MVIGRQSHLSPKLRLNPVCVLAIELSETVFIQTDRRQRIANGDEPYRGEWVIGLDDQLLHWAA